MIVYLAGPYRPTKTKTTQQHIEAARVVAGELWADGIPTISPHLNTGPLEGCAPEQTFLDGDLEIISRLKPGKDALLLLDGWQESSGTKAELGLAHKMGLYVVSLVNLRWAARVNGDPLRKQLEREVKDHAEDWVPYRKYRP